MRPDTAPERRSGHSERREADQNRVAVQAERRDASSITRYGDPERRFARAEPAAEHFAAIAAASERPEGDSDRHTGHCAPPDADPEPIGTPSDHRIADS